jgi:hypothetical protein
MYDRSEYTVTDSGINEYGSVWVKAIGPDYTIARRLVAAHSRKNGYGRWLSAGATLSPNSVEVRVCYHP